MITKNKEIEINQDNIFQNDVLNRKEIIEDLSKLIISYHEPFVFSINASWGSGKTTFIKLWKAYLEKEYGIKSIYFSAWEDDFSQEPLISILGELNAYLLSLKPNDIVQSKLRNVVTSGSKLVKRALPAFVKGVTSGVLDMDKGYEAALGAITEQATKELIDKYSENKAITQEFQKQLELLLKELDKDKPFIFFIDELDRCRPLYAIELMERIKHMFGVKRIVFILSIDKEQLSISIKSQYGNIDTENYLRRFIDLEYNLPKGDTDDFCNVLYSSFGIEEILVSKKINISTHGDLSYLKIFKTLIDTLDLSLRQIEQIFTQLSLIFRTIEPHFHDIHFRIIVLFLVLKSYDSDLYLNYINKKIDESEVINIFTKNNSTFFTENDLGRILEVIIHAAFKNETEYQSLIQTYKDKLAEITPPDGGKFRKIERQIYILEHTMEWGDYLLNNAVDTVIKKIEFTDRFNTEEEH